MTDSIGPVGVISNPGSGHNRTHFEEIEARLARCPSIVHVVTKSADDIEAALQTLAQYNISVLAINGGDGTTSAVLGAMLETKLFAKIPRIALLPGGTANMNAGDIGVRGSLKKAIERFCRWCEGGRETDGKLAFRSLMRVQNEHEQNPRYGMFLGGGAVIHGSEYAHENIHSRGVRDDLSLALGTFRTVWGVLRNEPEFNRHVTVELGLDAKPTQQFDTLILVISTLHRLAFGMRPFWSHEPGAVRITVFEQGCSRFVRTFVSIIRGRPSRNAVPASGYHSHNANQLSLNLKGKLNLDGEIFAADGRVDISATQQLEFLQL